jgi:hypothetical protein
VPEREQMDYRDRRRAFAAYPKHSERYCSVILPSNNDFMPCKVQTDFEISCDPCSFIPNILPSQMISWA